MKTITYTKLEKELLRIASNLFGLLADTSGEYGADRPTMNQKQHDDLNRAVGDVKDLAVEASLAARARGQRSILAAKAAIAAKKKGRG